MRGVRGNSFSVLFLVLLLETQTRVFADVSHEANYGGNQAPQSIEDKLSQLIGNSGFDQKGDLEQALAKGVDNMSPDDIALLEKFINSPDAANADPEVRNYLDLISQKMLGQSQTPQNATAQTTNVTSGAPTAKAIVDSAQQLSDNAQAKMDDWKDTIYSTQLADTAAGLNPAPNTGDTDPFLTLEENLLTGVVSRSPSTSSAPVPMANPNNDDINEMIRTVDVSTANQ